MRSKSLAVAAVASAGALVFALACKSSTENNCPSGTAPSLVGTYALLSYTIGTNTITAPPASGTLHFYTTLYGVSLSIPNGVGGFTVISDSGTYTVIGASCIQENSVLGQPQFAGSFYVNSADSTFRVTGSAAGQPAASTWKKTS